MIVNKIRRRQGGHSAKRADFAYIARLTRYIVRADNDDLRKLSLLSDDRYLRDLARYAIAEGRSETVLGSGAANLLGADLNDWLTEMSALLHRCPDSANAVDHWILSWKPEDEPSVAQVEDAVSIFLRCQGLEEAPVVWGVHGDTDNPHAHIAVMRIHPVTGGRLTAGDGWDIDAGHRAKAVIEAKYPQWTREVASIYEVRQGILIEQSNGRAIGPALEPKQWARFRRDGRATEAAPSSNPIKLDPQAVAYEYTTGLMSRSRVALQIAVPIMLQAESWDDAHRQLAIEGISIQTERSGAVFMIDGRPVKASVHRQTSLKKLEALYDAEFAPSAHTIIARPLRELFPNDARRRAYYAARRDHEAVIKLATQQISFIIGRGGNAKAVGAALAAATLSASFPSFDDWIGGAAAPDPATTILGALGVAAIAAPSQAIDNSLRSSTDGFCATILQGRTIYRSSINPKGRAAFVDIGNKIFVYDAADRKAVRASLLLIATRFPDDALVLTGSEQFCELVREIAREERVGLDGVAMRPAAGLGNRRVVTAPLPAMSNPEYDLLRNVDTRQPSQAVQKAPPNAVLAMISRVFHSTDWVPSDYWPSASPGREPILNLPRNLPVSDDLNVREISAPLNRLSEQASRAAAVAARASRLGL